MGGPVIIEKEKAVHGMKFCRTILCLFYKDLTIIEERVLLLCKRVFGRPTIRSEMTDYSGMGTSRDHDGPSGNSVQKVRRGRQIKNWVDNIQEKTVLSFGAFKTRAGNRKCCREWVLMASGLFLASQGFWKEDNDHCVSSRCAFVWCMDASVSVTWTVRVKPSLDISRVVLNIMAIIVFVRDI